MLDATLAEMSKVELSQNAKLHQRLQRALHRRMQAQAAAQGLGPSGDGDVNLEAPDANIELPADEDGSSSSSPKPAPAADQAADDGLKVCCALWRMARLSYVVRQVVASFLEQVVSQTELNVTNVRFGA